MESTEYNLVTIKCSTKDQDKSFRNLLRLPWRPRFLGSLLTCRKTPGALVPSEGRWWHQTVDSSPCSGERSSFRFVCWEKQNVRHVSAWMLFKIFEITVKGRFRSFKLFYVCVCGKVMDSKWYAQFPISLFRYTTWDNNAEAIAEPGSVVDCFLLKQSHSFPLSPMCLLFYIQR